MKPFIKALKDAERSEKEETALLLDQRGSAASISIADEISAPASVVFSLHSMLSTTITENTILAHTEVKRATDDLVSIFLEDRELKMLYKLAMEDERIDPERFQRNFKRLLKAFSQDLKVQVRESLDLKLANLVSSRAGLVSTGILEHMLVSLREVVPDDPKKKGLQVNNTKKASVQERVPILAVSERKPSQVQSI